VENVVEPIVVRFERVVRQAITCIDSIALLEDVQLAANLLLENINGQRAW
jgi:hypothetical protein